MLIWYILKGYTQTTGAVVSVCSFFVLFVVVVVVFLLTMKLTDVSTCEVENTISGEDPKKL